MIKVLFFAQLKEQLDCDMVELNIEQPIKLSALKQHLAGEDPTWQQALASPSIMAAVDLNMVSTDVLVQPGAEVAFFPPVTGG